MPSLQPARHFAYWRFVNAAGTLSRLTVLLQQHRHRRLATLTAPVRVALTTYPARADTAAAAIESITKGQICTPRAVTLVLAEDEFPDRKVPPSLSCLDGVDILWTSTNMRSFNKLVPVLSRYPDDVIVTVDDDGLCPPWWLGRLLAAHRRYPRTVVAYRAWWVGLDQGRLLPYESWGKPTRRATGPRVFPTGVGGVLYPPASLDPTVANWPLAHRLAPGTDDVWFWAMRILAGTPAVSLTGRFTDFKPVTRSKQGSLYLANCAGGQNDLNLHNVYQHFDLGRVLERQFA